MKKSQPAKKNIVPEGVYEAERRKRDLLLRDICYAPDEALRMQSRAVLDQYLEEHKKRKSIERYMVLDEIYGLSVPVDIETLLAMVHLDQGIMSQASIYNVLALLVEIGLVRKIDLLSGKRTFYERTIGEEPHGYSVCDTCGTVKRISLAKVIDPIYAQLAKGFVPKDSFMIIHGECPKCRRKKSRK